MHVPGVACHTLAYEAGLLSGSLRPDVPGCGEQLDALEAVFADRPFEKRASRARRDTPTSSPRRHPVAHFGDPVRPVDVLEVDHTHQPPRGLDGEDDALSRLAQCGRERADEP